MSIHTTDIHILSCMSQYFQIWQSGQFPVSNNIILGNGKKLLGWFFLTFPDF